jgi:hypothetical protein
MNELIRTGLWREWLNTAQEDTLIDVNLRRQTDNPATLQERVKFKWADSLLFGGGVILFFPHTTFESDKVLYVDEYKSFTDLDHAIFNALSKTKTAANEVQLAVVFGEYCYRIHGIQSNEHNYYIYWFDTLTRYDHEGYSKPMAHRVPCLVETDGYGSLTNIVCFNSLDIARDVKTLDPLYLKSHKDSYWPLQAGMMFTCENLSRLPQAAMIGKVLKTVDELSANAGVRNIVSKSTDNIFDSDTSIYLEEETDHNNNITTHV